MHESSDRFGRMSRGLHIAGTPPAWTRPVIGMLPARRRQAIDGSVVWLKGGADRHAPECGVGPPGQRCRQTTRAVCRSGRSWPSQVITPLDETSLVASAAVRSAGLDSPLLLARSAR